MPNKGNIDMIVRNIVYDFDAAFAWPYMDFLLSLFNSFRSFMITCRNTTGIIKETNAAIAASKIGKSLLTILFPNNSSVLPTAILLVLVE
jgi:hypothetical protein